MRFTVFSKLHQGNFENADFKTYGTVLKSAENRKVHVYFLRLLIDELSKKLKLMGKNINVSYF